MCSVQGPSIFNPHAPAEGLLGPQQQQQPQPLPPPPRQQERRGGPGVLGWQPPPPPARGGLGRGATAAGRRPKMRERDMQFRVLRQT